MKAARLYAYDEHMQVDLTLEMVPEPHVAPPMRSLCVSVRLACAALTCISSKVCGGVRWTPMGRCCRISCHENAGWVEDVGSGCTRSSLATPSSVTLATCGCARLPRVKTYCERHISGLNADALC